MPVCCYPIGHTSRHLLELVGASAGVAQEEGQHRILMFISCYVSAPRRPSAILVSIFHARRGQQSLSLVDSEVIFSVPATWSLSTVGHFVKSIAGPSEIRTHDPTLGKIQDDQLSHNIAPK